MFRPCPPTGGCTCRQQHAPLAVLGRLPRHVVEARNPGRIAHAEVLAIDADQRLAQIPERGLAVDDHGAFGQHHARLAAVGLADAVDAGGIASHSPRRILREIHFGDHPARGRIPAGELDAREPAHEAPAAVATDEEPRAKRAAIRQLDVDAGVILHEVDDLAAAVDSGVQLFDPFGQQPLDVILEQTEHVVVPRGQVADVERHEVKVQGGVLLANGQEALDDAALVQDLQRPRMQAARPRARELLVRAALDDGHVHPGEPELARQHQARRAAARDQHCVFFHRLLRNGAGPARRATLHPRPGLTASDQRVIL
jgi:hypothetical protein